MFHIPNDQRALRSTEMICEGLSKCLQHKSFTEISITDICAAAKVGRTTFYRLFDNSTDILAYQYEKLLQQLLQRHHKQNSSLALIMLSLITENKTLTELIVYSGRMDILIEVHRKYYKQLLEYLPQNIMITPQESEYFISILSCFIVGMVSIWGQPKQKPNLDDLYSSIAKIYQLLGYLL